MIVKRIKEYHAKTALVAEYYKSNEKLVEINGEGSVDDVFELLSAQIDLLIEA